jgi:glutathione S-transferase
VICDGEKVVHDSWNIAEYLEDTYPERPSLFAGSGGRAHARFVNEWTEAVLLPGVLPMIVVDLFQLVDPGDQPYFRENREARLGKTLEDAQADRELRMPSFSAMLSPLRATLSSQPWLGGVQPSYADHVVAAALMWPSCVSRFGLIPPDGPIFDWWQRVQLLYDSLAGNAVRS